MILYDLGHCATSDLARRSTNASTLNATIYEPFQHYSRCRRSAIKLPMGLLSLRDALSGTDDADALGVDAAVLPLVVASVAEALSGLVADVVSSASVVGAEVVSALVVETSVAVVTTAVLVEPVNSAVEPDDLLSPSLPGNKFTPRLKTL